MMKVQKMSDFRRGSDIMEMVLYHGTDLEIARKIKTEDFICKKNPEHWLGNGVYFFADEYLARWWTSNPSKKFGSEVKDAAILKVTLEVDDEHILDLRNFDTYIKVAQDFERYYDGLFMQFKLYPLTDNQFQCLFFDWYLITHPEIQMIIGTFTSTMQPYSNDNARSFSKKTKILYGEQQICLKSDCQHIIKKKEVVKI